jgi:hypothetical protein
MRVRHNNLRTAVLFKKFKNKNGDVIMANSNSSSNSSKTKKQSQGALDRFKMEVASEIGVNLKEGYNGDLTSAEAGSVGGNMVKKMIERQEEQMSSGN